MRLSKNRNPRLLDLLKMGCKITLPDGRYLTGEISTGYIVIGNEFDWLGRYDLSREGLSNALGDRDFNEEEV